MPGLQTLLATMLRLVDEGVIALADVARLCARNPAVRFGLGRRKGRIAPASTPTFSSSIRARECCHQCGPGFACGLHALRRLTVSATLTHVFLRGQEIMRDRALVAPALGAVVCRED